MLVCVCGDHLVIFYGEKKNLMEISIRQSFYRNPYVERILTANNNLFIVHMKHPAKYCSSRDIIFY